MNLIGWIVISALMLTAIGVIGAALFFFLRPEKASPSPVTPIPGERWYVIATEHNDGSPWYEPNPHKITVYITEVKEGWVRYHYGREDMPYHDPIEQFVRAWHREEP